MTRRWLLWTGVLLILLTAVSGCFGPQKFTRHMDDWFNQLYVDNPWLAGNTATVLVMQAVFVFTHIFDGLIVNPIDFWGVSAWPFGAQGHGTPFPHKTPTIPIPR